MADANVMKLARDRQLAYGRLPDIIVRLRHCEATGHRGVIEYGGGSLRCDDCLQFIRRPALSERSHASEVKP